MEMYTADGVAIASRLGLALADIVMVELESDLDPDLCDVLIYWRTYVDDTVCFVSVEQLSLQ